MRLLIICLSNLILCDCLSPEMQLTAPTMELAIPVVASADDLPQHVGKQIELIGVVSSDTYIPQIYGIEVWKLDQYRGKRVKVHGTLQMTVVTPEDIARRNREGLQHSGPGKKYQLDNLEYEVLP